ncbi:tetratricopeptide repeat protein [Paraburkholderia sp. CNPSo 3272]|uniref:tetratricopeptide repeat protein n=1 Tax=Paraburkholderia sp. CNPSo 3272 TaxID=2940931 RepID=UPI0020B6401C|nr:tetratricopeptide repeat protein [Paraburkholderia sp. CNPSo 3272]MCP3722582.1 tetratricopeptide repeat protein [Paraburkholderia sp. CNPSo 3272]
MTTVFGSGNQGNADSPGTHVLIVGAGEYPCLLGGDPARLMDKPMGLGQLSSPPLSAVALANWFVGRQVVGAQLDEGIGFHNPHAPLASVEMLVSPCLEYQCPDGTRLTVDAATRDHIVKGYRTWRARAKSNPGNIAVFYFCGHGAAGSNDYILPSDFGASNPDNPWADAIDITDTARAARREISGALYFFIDACRQPSWDSLAPGAGTPALQRVEFDRRVVCFTRMLLWATGEGTPAFGAKAQVSRFSAALIEALSGFYGEELAGTGNWAVTSEALATSVRNILQAGNASLDESLHQHAEQQLIGSQVLHCETRQPKNVGRVVSTWSANPLDRELAQLGGQALEAGAQEALAEQLEQRNLQVDELRREIEEWTRRYLELEQRLSDESDSELSQKARGYLLAGKLEEAGAFLDKLIEASEARILAEQERLASHYLSRAQVYSLQFKPTEALTYYREAFDRFPNNTQYSIPYANELLRQKKYQSAEPIYTSALAHLRRSAIEAPELRRDVVIILNNFGLLYSDTQRLTEAETAYQEAQGMSREMAETNPAAYLPDVANTLINLGNLYRSTQRLSEAETAYQEAQAISRKMAETNPAAYLPDVASALNNLGNLYRSTQRLTAAETAQKEALGIRRTLAETNPAAYFPDVAGTLNNLGLLYKHTQRLTEAEVAYQEAHAIYRKLCEDNPSAFLPDVAMTLNNLGMLYGDTQRPSEAESAHQEAGAIYWALSEANPATYLPSTATTLHNLANLYRDTQRLSEAEAAYQQALGIYRRFAEANATAYLPDVAMTLNSLGWLYWDMQRLTEAEAAYRRALAIRRKLARANPNAYLPDVAMTLNNLAMLFAHTQRLSRAETAYRNAHKLYRTLSDANPAAYLPNLSATLNNLGNLFWSAERPAEAEAAHKEALAIRRKLADANPLAYLPDVAATLYNLGTFFLSSERLNESEGALHEAFEIGTKLADANPAAHQPLVAAALCNLGVIYRTTHRPIEAERTWQQALDIQRRLAEVNVAAYLPDVAGTLFNLGGLYCEAQRLTEAESAYHEALNIRRKLAEANPTAFLSKVAATLDKLGILYQATQRVPEAEATSQEAEAIRRKLAIVAGRRTQGA